MIIKCDYGYFKFREDEVGEISRFNSAFGQSLVQKNDYYTFPILKDAQHYSILGKPYLGVPSIVTFEGQPWEVMRANKLVYDFSADLVLPIATIALRAVIAVTQNYFVSDGLLVPGSIREDGKRVTEYTARISWNLKRFKYTEVIYENA